MPVNGPTSVQSSPVAAMEAVVAPMMASTSDACTTARRRRRGGADRGAFRAGTVVRDSAESGSPASSSYPLSGGNGGFVTVIGSGLAQRTGAGTGHDDSSEEVDHQGQREQSQARCKQGADGERGRLGVSQRDQA